MNLYRGWSRCWLVSYLDHSNLLAVQLIRKVCMQIQIFHRMKLTKLVKNIRKLTLEHFQLYHSQNTTTKNVLCYTFTDARRGVCSVGESHCALFLVESLSCRGVCLKNLSLVTNHPIMVKIAEGKKETIYPPT